MEYLPDKLIHRMVLVGILESKYDRNHEMSTSQQLQEDYDPARSWRASLHCQIVAHCSHQDLLHSSSTDPERQMDRIRLPQILQGASLLDLVCQ